MSLEIQGSTLHLSLQGAQEPRRRRFGVPVGGAFDQELWKLANAVVGNRAFQSALEIAFSGFNATVIEDCRIAILGAPFQVDDKLVLGCLAHVQSGQYLSVGTPYGARAYFSASGGWSSFEGSRLSSNPFLGNLFVAHSVATPERYKTIRVVPFGSSDRLDGHSFTVSTRLDRVGIRLKGTKVEASTNEVSEPTCFGAIQATGDGQLIILGPDGPTVGGYSTQAVICSADLDLVAQVKPGDKIEFETIDLEEARQAGVAKRASLAKRVEDLLEIRL